MKRLPMSKAASAVLRALLARAGEDSDRFLLTEVQSTDWHSLTFVGERHQFRFSVHGPRADDLLNRVAAGLQDAEFDIPGHVVADVAVEAVPARSSGEALSVSVEALTIAA